MNSIVNNKFDVKSWIMAARPKTLSAAIVPIVASVGLVQSEKHLVDWWIVVFGIRPLDRSAIFVDHKRRRPLFFSSVQSVHAERTTRRSKSGVGSQIALSC